MELSKKGIADRTAFEQKGYALPQFDREEMIAKTKKRHTGFTSVPVISSVPFRPT